jgi:hypothetical protein
MLVKAVSSFYATLFVRPSDVSICGRMLPGAGGEWTGPNSLVAILRVIQVNKRTCTEARCEALRPLLRYIAVCYCVRLASFLALGPSSCKVDVDSTCLLGHVAVLAALAMQRAYLDTMRSFLI